MLIHEFSVKKLHGYKNINLKFDNKAKILIAENGSGKTAFLSILSKILQRDWVRLREIEFESASITFIVNKKSKEITIKRQEISSYLNKLEQSLSNNEKFMLEASKLNFKDVYHFCTQQYDPENYKKTENHFIINSLYDRTPFTHKVIKKFLSDIIVRIEPQKNGKITIPFLNKHNDVKKAISDSDILYLPTYRRIEINNYKNNYKDRADDNGASYFYHYDAEIKFGVDDVEDRLMFLAKEISQINSSSYMSLTGSIIDDFIKNNDQIYTSYDIDLLPSINEVNNFFARVIEDENLREERIKSLKRIYEDKNFDSNKNLFYFLRKMKGLIEKTSYIEKGVLDFVSTVNEFLKLSGESKYLKLTKEKLEVQIINSYDDTPLDFDYLSSGEKHIISLIASVYLYEKPRIILIDEPEISLSIDWQEKILPALLKSENCSQLIAITHSPFIFSNELDPYAQSLVFEKVSK